MYGAASSLMAILVWVYYSALIFFLGAEFTYVYAHQFGSRRPTTCNRVAKMDAE
jgi:membrane protein